MATFRARSKAGLASMPSAFMCIVRFVAIITAAVLNDPIQATAGHPPTHLVVYDHQTSVPPNNTVVYSVSTNGDYTGLNQSFGSITVLANVLRETTDGDSAVLGQLDGQLTVERDSGFYVSAVLVFHTPGYSGSVTAQGKLDSAGGGELAITGGTKDFRFARGYIVTRFTGKNVGRQVIVFELTLHIKYD